MKRDLTIENTWHASLGVFYIILFVFFYSLTEKRLIIMNEKIDTLISNTDVTQIDSLKQEIMDIGWELDSMTLKYEHNWTFKD
jgi:hypothetical protein